MTEREELISLISDTSKDLRGFRERGEWLLTEPLVFLREHLEFLQEELEAELQFEEATRERVRREEAAHAEAVKAALSPAPVFTLALAFG